MLLRYLEIIPAPNATEVSTNDFATECLKKRRLEKNCQNSAYLNPAFFLATSDIVEKFFSSAGYAYSDYRQNLLPMNLECQLFFKIIISFGMNPPSIM